MVNEEITEAGFRLLGSLIFLTVIFAISYWKGLKLTRTIIYSLIRGMVQLFLLASIFVYLFSLEHIAPLFGVLTVMILFGALTASRRISDVPNIFKIELISLGISVYSLMIVVSILGIIPIDNQSFWIPIGGMIAGNCMNISFLAINRIKDDVYARKGMIEAALSLGAGPQEALMRLDVIPNSLRVSVIPVINNLRTLGLVVIPGLMTGLLIGGVDPIAAAFYQVLIYVLIIAGGLMAGTIGSILTVQNLFHKEDECLIV